jgi:hypothetical protein
MLDHYQDNDHRISLEELNSALDIDPLDMPAVRAEASVMLDLLAYAADYTGRAALSAIRNLGCAALKRNGTLNVNKIARLIGQPQRTTERHIDKLQRIAMSLSI